MMNWIGEILCRRGFHKWVDCTIKWKDGGPYLEWWMCDRCDELEPAVDGDQWRPFTVEKDSRKPTAPMPI